MKYKFGMENCQKLLEENLIGSTLKVIKSKLPKKDSYTFRIDKMPFALRGDVTDGKLRVFFCYDKTLDLVTHEKEYDSDDFVTHEFHVSRNEKTEKCFQKYNQDQNLYFAKLKEFVATTTMDMPRVKIGPALPKPKAF